MNYSATDPAFIDRQNKERHILAVIASNVDMDYRNSPDFTDQERTEEIASRYALEKLEEYKETQAPIIKALVIVSGISITAMVATFIFAIFK